MTASPYDHLECVSAFDLAPSDARFVLTLDQTGTGAAIEGVELPDVVFLPHVLEHGQSLCVVQDGYVPLELVLDPWVVVFFKERAQRGTPPPAVPEVSSVEEGVCILGALFSRNFGHWTEALLKVAVLETAVPGRYRYVVPTLPAFAREWLGLLGVASQRILTVDVPTRFSRAVFTTAVSHENLSTYPQVLFALRNRVNSRVSVGETTGRRLWLERREGLVNGGTTLNVVEVYPILARHGVEVCDMATLSTHEQLRLVLGASLIAGPHGSQFVLSQFLPPGSTVIECFSPTHVNPSILQICRVLGHSYHQVVSRCNVVASYEHGRDCMVDVEHLQLILDSVPDPSRSDGPR